MGELSFTFPLISSKLGALDTACLCGSEGHIRYCDLASSFLFHASSVKVFSLSKSTVLRKELQHSSGFIMLQPSDWLSCSENHMIIQDVSSPTSCSKQGQLRDQDRLLRDLTSWVLKNSKAGGCKTSMTNVLPIVPMGKKAFPYSQSVTLLFQFMPVSSCNPHFLLLVLTLELFFLSSEAWDILFERTEAKKTSINSAVFGLAVTYPM